MELKTIRQKEAIKLGWDIALKKIWFFVVILIFIGVLNSLMSSLTASLEKQNVNFIFIFIVDIVSFAISLLMSLGLIKISLDLIKDLPVKFSDLFSGRKLILKQFVGSIIIFLAITLPIAVSVLIILLLAFLKTPIIVTIIIAILLIVIALAISIWLGLKFTFYSYFIVDKGAGPIEALKLSSKITDKVKWRLLLLSLTLAGINILGFLALFVGLFITIPLSTIAKAKVYRQLSEQTEGLNN